MTEEEVRRHPLHEKIEEAEELVHLTLNASADLVVALEQEVDAREKAVTTADVLAAAINEARLELIITGKAGDGPLAGLAVSSKAYSIALESAVDTAKSSPKLAPLVDAERKARWHHEDAKTAIDVSRTEFQALRHATDLKAAILRAASA